ncbi:alpha/beta hydrolase [Saccharopolyspora pogona]|uniref:alpha/beta hydrolase n=1 Tax=Saccharopolyspora pogona TaxID=333966 RepID=UPI00168651A3|nr:alpha/beta hydrolase [Saccharopolyspora pogona]
MASPESAVLTEMFKNVGARLSADPPIGLDSVREIFDCMLRFATEAEGVSYRSDRTGPVPGMWAFPPDAVSDAVILYLHGGGYISGSTSGHRRLFAHLAKESGVRAFAIDYRLAPEHLFPAQLDDARAAYDHLLAQGYAPQRIAVVGDSAGGSLATALGLHLADGGQPSPAAIVAMSPYYDVLGEGETFVTNVDNDVVAPPAAAMEPSAAVYLGDPARARTDHYVNPLISDPSGLPPMLLTCGGYECLLSGVETFAELARSKGVKVELDVAPEMQHVFQFLVGHAPEATESVARISEFIRTSLNDSGRAAAAAPSSGGGGDDDLGGSSRC